MPTPLPFFERTRQWLQKFAFEQMLLVRERREEFEQASTAWRLDLPNESLHFFERPTVLRWAAKTGASEAQITEVQTQQAQPKALNWLNQQRLAGMDVGSSAQHISSAGPQSVDTMVAWFNSLDRFDPAAAFALLNLGFAADRPDVIDAIAEWTKGAPWFWFNYTHMSGPMGDTAANNPGNESTRGVFSRMLQSATLTNWVFEHHPELKARLLDPKKWAELQKGLEQTSPQVQSEWPWIAHKVFDLKELPWHYKRCFQLVHTRQKLHESFTHDPAAQCYISYSAFKEAPWLKQTANEYPTNILTCPDVQLFHAKMVALQNNDSMDLPSSDLVDNLLLGVHLDMDPKEFYHHASAMFHQKGHRPDIAPMDPALFC